MSALVIKLHRAKQESRKRDKKRQRFILTIGKKRFHLTPKEVRQLEIRAMTLLRLEEL